MQPAKELIKEIAVLEYEVVHLEQYLLTLYRRAFEQQGPTSSPSTDDESFKSPIVTQKAISLRISGLEITPKSENVALQSNQLFPHESITQSLNKQAKIQVKDEMLDSGVHRSRSSLSQHSARSPPMANMAKAVRTCYSQPLSYLEVDLYPFLVK